MVEYRKVSAEAFTGGIPLFSRSSPTWAANCFRYGLYRLLGRTQKAYKTKAES